MKTAMMMAPPLGGTAAGNSAGSGRAVESAVDAYATKVLASSSPPEAFIDTSLGPYVTSVLRCTEISDKDQVTELMEFDSLLELLEDQCNMEQQAATNALRTIAHAVVTGVVPQEHSEAANRRGRSASVGSASGGLYTVGGGLDSFQSVKASLPEITVSGPTSIDPYTPSSTGGPSPLKPDNLIPVDLLGFLDDPSPNSIEGHAIREVTMPKELRPPRPQPPTEKKVAKDEEAFPPLGAAGSTPAPSAHNKAPAPVSSTSSKKQGRGKHKGSKSHSDKELAAALFRPSRPRQNSIENEEAALRNPSSSTSPPLSSLQPPSLSEEHQRTRAASSQYVKQQWDSCVEILLSMNSDLSEEAAVEAGRMANTDFNIAQFVVDSAMSAPPICRHLLHDGCYRSDCQFSHDVEGHTCLFWLRGRCGKGASCKFLHGYNKKLLDGIEMSNVFPSDPTASTLNDPEPTTSQMGSTGRSSFESPYSFRSASPSEGLGTSVPSGGFHGKFQGFNQDSPDVLGSSWPSPSLSESNLSSSVPSTKSGFSFANIASRGYDKTQFASSTPSPSNALDSTSNSTIPTVRIPQDLWNPHENRDSSVFHIPDPMERYQKVASMVKLPRKDVVDLHFQSTKTFSAVLSNVLPKKLAELESVWIVTGTGHHVGTKTHQKGGGALERAVFQWLTEEGYNFFQGRDRNGLGGAILVKR